MKALTLWQPWAWAVAHAGKQIENRTWRPPASVIGQRIAIHAGKHVDSDAEEWLAANGYDVPSPPRGAVVATAVVSGWCKGDYVKPLLDDPFYAIQEFWWSGPVGWFLSWVQALRTPVPCRGAQGLWELPPAIEAEVLRQCAPEPPRTVTVHQPGARSYEVTEHPCTYCGRHVSAFHVCKPTHGGEP